MEKEPVFLHSLLMLVFFVAAIIGVRSALKKRIKISCYWALIGIPSYLVYELTMPSYINIRADLIIIYPLLLISVVTTIICSSKHQKRTQEKIKEQSWKRLEDYFGEKVTKEKLEILEQKIINSQASSEECALMLGIAGYKVVEKHGHWVVHEPLGGKVELTDLCALNEYSVGKYNA